MDTPSTSPGTPEHRSGVLQDVRSLAHELRGLFHAHVGLAALETRQAGESLVWMITLGVMVGGLLLSAWLGLLAVAVLTLIQYEYGVMTSPGAALLLAVGANLLLALILYWAIRRRRTHLQFPATVNSLTPDTEKSS
ncbi:phage holin family protein [Ectothiorhodospira lacustris]|uniref:phage holin family protein n=1 Tax=Ectothiorhodospira lacustris TaxID=2899127 RepID=UPI001EE923D5|nr:phage holin family protein [Ectothiorhodospira lacustris]MCG5502089.1 phage holin family protein [Ectothiorhodospira lacustris]MCG5508816.1 phage holin family protein [Ectothiorhodospira lacustris]MCG5520607.1 phage holin family protein [Ectothiorhodospira lacustris]